MRSRHEKPGRTRALGLACTVSVVGLLAAAGCDPCAGVIACDTTLRISLEGQLIVHETGEPAPDVEVVFVPSDPSALGTDSVFATTNDDGRYLLSAPAATDGEITGKIIVRPSSNPAYEVDGITLSSRSVRGDGDIIGERWVVDPYFDFLGELYATETGRPIGVESRVVFRRTGGIEIEPDSFATNTDLDGRFILSPDAIGHGEVFGDLRVEGIVADRFQVLHVPGVRLSTTYVQRPLGVQGVFYLGRTINYVGAIAYNAQSRAAAGVPVTFRKTSGIDRFPDVVEMLTDDRGQFRLNYEPENPGVVRGVLEFELDGPVGRVVEPLELLSRDVGGQVRIPDLTYGPALNYVGEVRGEQTGNALEGRRVLVRRVSGIAVEEDEYVTTVDAGGRFRLNLFPSAAGSVVLEITVDLPGGEFVRLIELETFNATQSRLAAVWYVPGL